jgi:hypothetical protein
MDYAIIGDVHSDYKKLKLAFEYANNHKLQIILLGDLFDSRCQYSDSVGVYNLVRNSDAIVLQSNHQDKLIRYLMGNPVTLNNGLDITVKEFKDSKVSKDELLDWLTSFPYGMVFKNKDNKEMRCSHAYFSSKVEIPDYEESHFVTKDSINQVIRNLMIYGPTQKQNKSERISWWKNPRHKDYIMVSGHYRHVHIDELSIVLDGGCGGPDKEDCLCLYDVNKKLLKKIY